MLLNHKGLSFAKKKNTSAVILHKIDNSFGYVECDDYNIISTIHDSMSFWVPGYRFMPSYQMGTFDGKIKLMSMATRKYPLGLTDHICEQCKTLKVPCTIKDDLLSCFSDKVTTAEEIKKFCQEIPVYHAKQRIYPREDQIEAVIRAILKKRCVNICPTSFGKSLSITLECVWFIKKIMRCLIVVPTKALVEQFRNDIMDYATSPNGKEAWCPTVQMIFSGQSKELDEDTDICISTWQSLARLDSNFSNQFDVLILDECHKGAAPKINAVMSTASEVMYRTGWTGTLSNETIGELQVRGLFGPVKEITTTKELMDKKIVAQLMIVIVRIIYTPEEKVKLNNLLYQDQIKYHQSDIRRSKLLIRIAGTQNKTGLILFKKIKHGQALFELARSTFSDRNIYLIYGSHVQMNEKIFKSIEDIKDNIEHDEHGIIFANIQIAGTGISIRNLNWLMFATPIKSFISTIQAIGRILRVSDIKSKATLIDIVDDFSYTTKRSKNVENYALMHFCERYAMYINNHFDYKVTKLSITTSSGE